MKKIVIAAFVSLLTASASLPAWAQSSRADMDAAIADYLGRNPESVQRIVKDYLIKNPEVLEAAIQELMKKRQGGSASAGRTDKSDEIANNADLLFRSTRQVVLGNPGGDVTLVEFFDYGCGYCKRALSDMMELLKDDSKLRIVLKEWPILGQGSVEVARVAVAVRMQDPAGEKYLTFHHKMLSDRGPASKSRAMAVAAEAGVDMVRLERDLASAEIDQTFEESAKLARSLGLNGTPGYVLGETIIPGAVGASALKERIQAVRAKKQG